MRSDQSSSSFQVGHCHKQLTGMNNYIKYITGAEFVPVLYRDALAKGHRPIHFTVFLTGKAFLPYSYFNLRCRIKASSLRDKTEGEYGIVMNNYQQN